MLFFDTVPDPDSLTMHIGLSQSSLGDVVGVEHVVTVGYYLRFTCVVRNAQPPAQITWDLDGDSQVLTGLDSPANLGNSFDTFNSLQAPYHSVLQSDCNKVLTCTSMHPQTGDEQTASTILKVIGRVIV